MAVNNPLLLALIAVAGTTSITLTFYHPVVWAPTAGFVGIAALCLIARTVGTRNYESVPTYAVLLCCLAAVGIAAVWGAVHDFYNVRQLAFVGFGLVLGYLISVVRAPAWLAWTPFLLFTCYFLVLIALGRDPGETLTRNSRNFVSVILLALYVTAVLLAKPPKVTGFHFLAALFLLLVAIWSTGRAGIIAAVLLLALLTANVLLRGRMTFLRALAVLMTLAIAGVALVLGVEFLLSQGLFTRIEERGMRDPARLAMIVSYFQGIRPAELVFGRNYYDVAYLGMFEFNLHNSYLSAWAHLGALYLGIILLSLWKALTAVRTRPVIAIAVIVFALRAVTDTQMLVAKYDYIFLATLFILLRKPSPSRAPRRSVQWQSPTGSGGPGTSGSSRPVPAQHEVAL